MKINNDITKTLHAGINNYIKTTYIINEIMKYKPTKQRMHELNKDKTSDIQHEINICRTKT